jgi:uncharacterized protein (TIGR03435 family)
LAETSWVKNLDRALQAIRRSVLVVVICSVAVDAALGQTANDGPDNGVKLQEFEVATIKPHPSGDGIISIGGPPSRFDGKNLTVKILVEQAFGVPADQVTGGPPWIESQHFDVSAKISDTDWDAIKGLDFSHRQQAVNRMLQTLLKDRFRLVVSHQPKELTVYALVQARGGAKLRIHGEPEPPKPPDSGARTFMMVMEQKDIPVSTLANFLSGHFRRTVLDRTGLTGNYDIRLEVGTPADNSPDEGDSPIFRALEDQLGLKLVSRKEVVDTIMIEHLEQPSAN